MYRMNFITLNLAKTETMQTQVKADIWQIVLFTPQGVKTEIYNTSSMPLEQFEANMVEKYKTFVMHKCSLI